MRRPHVFVRIIPRSAGAHAGKDGAFRIVNFDARDSAYAEARGGGRLIELCDEVEEFRMDFDLLGQKAASDDASRILIEKRLEAVDMSCVNGVTAQPSRSRKQRLLFAVGGSGDSPVAGRGDP